MTNPSEQGLKRGGVCSCETICSEKITNPSQQGFETPKGGDIFDGGEKSTMKITPLKMLKNHVQYRRWGE
jgi:hypothetical protein